jgi:predicted  nucleic acid-binding Zn-ribbon protein
MESVRRWKCTSPFDALSLAQGRRIWRVPRQILSTGNQSVFPAKFTYFTMLKEIEQLLLLQERDQKIKVYTAELETVPLERQRIDQLVAAKSNAFEQVRQRSRDLEVQRKRLELDAQTRRDSIAKYKTQQYQTRKNEEFQAISQEIHRFEQEIERIEDHEIELMEQTEQFQKEAVYAEAELKAAKRQAELQHGDLIKKEATLGERLKQAEVDREQLTQGLDEDLLFRYTRLFATKGGNAVVPVEHEFCMGCHMKNTTALVHRAKMGREIVHCQQCGRIMYYAD